MKILHASAQRQEAEEIRDGMQSVFAFDGGSEVCRIPIITCSSSDADEATRLSLCVSVPKRRRLFFFPSQTHLKAVA
ncbi:hypothetical protein AV530_003814 [Patagioenas fasciata monilis]|uniref:Uncharacterized protein n=1 Tax=Patagioenas fasciata monilis TaxID=372326 RepID=A0A1V4KYP8_PATFA|nr:hypothetical protein AV530_003814 [Patagioenas fasciata monilis]